METEAFFSGYCRTLDGSRVVTAVIDGGKLTEVDCDYKTCLYAAHCQIGRAITQKLAAE